MKIHMRIVGENGLEHPGDIVKALHRKYFPRSAGRMPRKFLGLFIRSCEINTMSGKPLGVMDIILDCITPQEVELNVKGVQVVKER